MRSGNGFAFLGVAGTTTRDIGARRGTVRSRRPPLYGLPSSVLGGLNRYVTHLFDHIASLSSTFTHIGDNPAFTRWRSLNADERNPGLPIPHRAGDLTRHISYIRTESSFKLKTTCVARHASSSTIMSDCDIAGGCPQLRRHNRLLRNERRGRRWRARQGILQNLISNHVSRVRLLIAAYDVLPAVLVALVDKKLRPHCRWRA